MIVAQDFEVWSLEPGFRDYSTERMMQFDAIFVRVQQRGLD
jgi:hypothetical protein